MIYTMNKQTISRSKVGGSIEAERYTTRALKGLSESMWPTTILCFTLFDSNERTTLHALIHVVVGRKKISMIIQFMAMLTAYTSCSRLIKAGGLSQCACLQKHTMLSKACTPMLNNETKRSMLLGSYMRRLQGFL